MGKELVKLEDVWFKYNKEQYVLKRVNFSVREKEIIGIAGPNGSGKTTLVKHLNGLLKPVKGKVLLEGEEVKKPRELTKYVGMVFQNPEDQVFFPIVEEDIAFGLRNMGLEEKEVEKRVNYALEVLKINHLRERSFFRLSFGEKKKVSIAGVLAMQPPIMVLDEPTLGLDPWSKNDFIMLIKEIGKKSTLVITTHDFDVLKNVDRIVFLRDGEIKGEYDSFRKFEEEAL